MQAVNSRNFILANGSFGHDNAQSLMHEVGSLLYFWVYLKLAAFQGLIVGSQLLNWRDTDISACRAVFFSLCFFDVEFLWRRAGYQANGYSVGSLAFYEVFVWPCFNSLLKKTNQCINLISQKAKFQSLGATLRFSKFPLGSEFSNHLYQLKL